MGVFDPYPSRLSTPQGLVARQEPVVYGQEPMEAGLTPEQWQSYADNGFLVIPHYFSGEETAHYKQALQALLADKELAQAPNAITEPDSGAIRSLFAFHQQPGVLAQLVQDPRLLSVAQAILGSPVYLHQTRANFKPGFVGKSFYWHSDFETWHVEDGMPRMRAVSCSILLTDNAAYNGPLMLIPGSHRYFVPCLGQTPEQHYQQSLKCQQYGVPSQEHLSQLVEQGGIHTVEAPAGSVIFFDCNTLHASTENISPMARSNLFMVYNSVKNPLQAPKYGLAPRPDFLAHRQSFKAVG